MPLDFRLLISLLSDFCCLIKVYRRLLGRPVLKLLSCWSPRGGGGTLIFSAYVGSDPASTLHPKKLSGISSTPNKIFEILASQKSIPNSVH